MFLVCVVILAKSFQKRKDKEEKSLFLSDEEVVMNEKGFFSFLKALTRVELETWKTELNNSIYF